MFFVYITCRIEIKFYLLNSELLKITKGNIFHDIFYENLHGNPAFLLIRIR